MVEVSLRLIRGKGIGKRNVPDIRSLLMARCLAAEDFMIGRPDFVLGLQRRPVGRIVRLRRPFHHHIAWYIGDALHMNGVESFVLGRTSSMYLRRTILPGAGPYTNSPE